MDLETFLETQVFTYRPYLKSKSFPNDKETLLQTQDLLKKPMDSMNKLQTWTLLNGLLTFLSFTFQKTNEIQNQLTNMS